MAGAAAARLDPRSDLAAMASLASGTKMSVVDARSAVLGSKLTGDVLQQIPGFKTAQRDVVEYLADNNVVIQRIMDASVPDGDTYLRQLMSPGAWDIPIGASETPTAALGRYVDEVRTAKAHCDADLQRVHDEAKDTRDQLVAANAKIRTTEESLRLAEEQQSVAAAATDISAAATAAAAAADATFGETERQRLEVEAAAAAAEAAAAREAAANAVTSARGSARGASSSIDSAAAENAQAIAAVEEALSASIPETYAEDWSKAAQMLMTASSGVILTKDTVASFFDEDVGEISPVNRATWDGLARALWHMGTMAKRRGTGEGGGGWKAYTPPKLVVNRFEALSVSWYGLYLVASRLSGNRAATDNFVKGFDAIVKIVFWMDYITMYGILMKKYRTNAQKTALYSEAFANSGIEEDEFLGNSGADKLVLPAPYSALGENPEGDDIKFIANVNWWQLYRIAAAINMELPSGKKLKFSELGDDASKLVGKEIGQDLGFLRDYPDSKVVVYPSL